MIDQSLISEPGVPQLLTGFYLGLLSVLTPCVYPLIPITLAVFGAAGETSRLRSFSLALTYVLGMSAVYTTLGMISARTGTLFGANSASPYVIIPVSIVLLGLTLMTLDVFQSKLAYSLQTWASKIGGKGYGGAFLMGTVSGLVAAPCVGPLLILVLTVAATTAYPAWGAALLFAYSLGLGSLFLVLGLFPNLVSKLPRSGNWLHVVKFVIAVGLLMAICFLANPLLRLEHNLALLGKGMLLALLGLIGLGVAVLAFKKYNPALKFASALMLALVLYQGFVAASPIEHAEAAVAWSSTLEDGLSKANDRGTIAFVDLSAEWCAACKELDAHTFPDPNVQQLLTRVAPVRLDFTDPETEANQAVQERYKVAGLPCLLFLNPDGSEIAGSRITGFLGPKEFASHVEKVLSESAS